MSEIAPDVLGTPPEPRRSALVRRAPPVDPPQPPYRSLIASLYGTTAAVVVVIIVGVWPDSAPAAFPALFTIGGIAGASNVRAVGEHLARRWPVRGDP